MADTGVDDFGHRIVLLAGEYLRCEVCGVQEWPGACASYGSISCRAVEEEWA